ncbi:hypothetical protein BDY21DRAFT_345461 [Lineolata rhizophorae]|uniref:Uncharacterized protein n=1 Tax=Lineolata rhizophorae TaxID=578093 RepID=A0A6A6NZY1_9PEZI|nr:hypothetical protein BDY21DRAFT_345461 [Lineolata rhizophorae]
MASASGLPLGPSLLSFSARLVRPAIGFCAAAADHRTTKYPPFTPPSLLLLSLLAHAARSLHLARCAPANHRKAKAAPISAPSGALATTAGDQTSCGAGCVRLEIVNLSFASASAPRTVPRALGATARRALPWPCFESVLGRGRLPPGRADEWDGHLPLDAEAVSCCREAAWCGRRGKLMEREAGGRAEGTAG